MARKALQGTLTPTDPWPLGARWEYPQDTLGRLMWISKPVRQDFAMGGLSARHHQEYQTSRELTALVVLSTGSGQEVIDVRVVVVCWGALRRERLQAPETFSGVHRTPV